jgi:hypothetical protein
VPEGDACTADADCCAAGDCALRCIDGLCAQGDVCCVPLGGPCTSDGECCDGACDEIEGFCGELLI